jgi:hypothetical protein
MTLFALRNIFAAAQKHFCSPLGIEKIMPPNIIIDSFSYQFADWSIDKRFAIPIAAENEYQKQKQLLLSDVMGRCTKFIDFLKESQSFHIGQKAHVEHYRGKTVMETDFNLTGQETDSCAYQYNHYRISQRTFKSCVDPDQSTTHRIYYTPRGPAIDMRTNDASTQTSLSMRFIQYKDKNIGVSSFYISNQSDIFEKPLVTIKDPRDKKLICLNNNFKMAQDAFDNFLGELPERYAHSHKFLDILLPVQESFDLLRTPRP